MTSYFLVCRIASPENPRYCLTCLGSGTVPIVEGRVVLVHRAPCSSCSDGIVTSGVGLLLPLHEKYRKKLWMKQKRFLQHRYLWPD